MRQSAYVQAQRKGCDQQRPAKPFPFLSYVINEPIIPRLARSEDLIALGLQPGPKFGEILEAVETRQLEGALKTHEEALDWVKREYSLGEL